MASFSSALRSFWHTMTSEDRHASHDSAARASKRMTLNSARHNSLTSVSTTPLDSTANIHSPYVDEPIRRSSSNGFVGNGDGQMASPNVGRPSSPYSPGLRSSSAAIARTHSREINPFDKAKPGEIQMQNFQGGAPPPPPVSHSWGKIDKWAESNYEELYDQLSGPATNNDLNELEHELGCSLPLEVRESLQIHDGQERGGRPTGIIFSCMLLDCEEIAQEWQNWRKVNSEYLSDRAAHRPPPQQPAKALGAASSSRDSPIEPQQPPSTWRQELQFNQDSQPPNAVQSVYAHPGWIPLARDWGGNNLAVDLAPGPTGKWGQVIIFGRDYDCKYVVARSWSAFVAMVADDLNSGKWLVEEDSGDLKLKEFKTSNVEPAYLDILRWRMDQKYGRKAPRRKGPVSAPNGPRLNTNLSSRPGSSSGSPYTSPTLDEPSSSRSRSPQRFGSPKPGFGRPSPLSQVTQDPPGEPTVKSPRPMKHSSVTASKLVEVATPRASDEDKRKISLDKEEMKTIGLDGGDESVKGLGVDVLSGIDAK
ncbi:MAG: Cell wall assembly regulator [Vezdaea aestivalis]|nr:MAG: Cell wall assembly regulator [Vezdaea aestivalis]